jgi:hypothetical protein
MNPLPPSRINDSCGCCGRNDEASHLIGDLEHLMNRCIDGVLQATQKSGRPPCTRQSAGDARLPRMPHGKKRPAAGRGFTAQTTQTHIPTADLAARDSNEQTGWP